MDCCLCFILVNALKQLNEFLSATSVLPSFQWVLLSSGFHFFPLLSLSDPFLFLPHSQIASFLLH